MNAVAWRLFRSQAIWGAATLAAVGVVLLATGPHLVHVYDTEVSACKSAGGVGPACANTVVGTYQLVQNLEAAVVLIGPALVGIFWGAPLIARELETGTFRLAWTQGVTRTRWLVTKLFLGGLVSLLAGAVLSLAATWWFAPIDAVNQNRFSPAVFQVHGIVPGGYALFAFALGATGGVVFRRVLPAMATTLVGYVAARFVITYEVRPHLLPPAHLTQALSPATFGISLSPSGPSAVANAPELPNAWFTSVSIVDKAGQAPTSAVIKHACASLPGIGAPLPGPLGPGARLGSKGGGAVAAYAGKVQAAMSQCMTTLGRSYHVVATYQPANRFWSIQVLETAVFVLAAVALGALCAWWITRRLT